MLIVRGRWVISNPVTMVVKIVQPAAKTLIFYPCPTVWLVRNVFGSSLISAAYLGVATD